MTNEQNETWLVDVERGLLVNPADNCTLTLEEACAEMNSLLVINHAAAQREVTERERAWMAEQRLVEEARRNLRNGQRGRG